MVIVCFYTQQNDTIKNCRNDKFIIIQNEQIVNLPRRTQVLTVAVRSSQFHFNLKNEKPRTMTIVKHVTCVEGTDCLTRPHVHSAPDMNSLQKQKTENSDIYNNVS